MSDQYLSADELRDLAHRAMEYAALLGRTALRPTVFDSKRMTEAADLLRASDVFHYHANVAELPEGSNDD